MNISRRWLEAWLRRPLDTRDLVARLAMLGAPVDLVEPQYRQLESIVVGRVEEVRAHPNADRLRVCRVAVGDGQERQVVTGAPNVAVGRSYPFAGVGVTLPSGPTLERKKLRGEISEGMLCSARELGLGEEHDGLLELTGDAPPGTPLARALELDDDRLVLDVSPVRGDLLGHRGVARELAAAYGTTFRLPAVPGSPAADVPAFRRSAEPAVTAGLAVAIEPGSAGRRFTAAVIDGVRVGPSPAWLAERLLAVGQRPINNVVDVTNYVMFELGQPLHAYDADRLEGGRLAARLARPGETLVTLDGAERTLDPSMTVVADGGRPVGVAGVMGGQHTAVTDATSRVVLEAAWWDPAATRATRRALGILSDAAHRFERGTDLWAVPESLVRALEVLLTVAGGRVVDAPLDVWPEPSHPPRVFLRVARVAQIVGLELAPAEIERTLVAIGATVLAKPDDGRFAVDVPGWRTDLTSEIDLVEEVARIHGYDRLPDAIRPFRPGNQQDAPSEIAAARIRAGMVASGLFEVVTLPMGPRADGPAVRIANPLSADHALLRSRVLPNLVRQVEANWANQIRDVRLFEIGTVFAPGVPGERPHECTRLGGVITGDRWPAHWADGDVRRTVDWWDLKGLFERAVSLAYPQATVQVEGATLFAADGSGRRIGEARVMEADAPPWAAPVFGFEIEIASGGRAPTPYVPLPVVPAAARDLALVVPPGVTAQAVLGVARRVGGGLLEEVRVIDEYRGPGIAAGARSLAVRLVFRGRDRTLRDHEIDGAVNRIRAALEAEQGVSLRGT